MNAIAAAAIARSPARQTASTASSASISGAPLPRRIAAPNSSAPATAHWAGTGRAGPGARRISTTATAAVSSSA